MSARNAQRWRMGRDRAGRKDRDGRLSVLAGTSCREWHRHRRSLLRAPACCVRLEVSPPASALSSARSAPLAVLSLLHSLPICTSRSPCII